MADENDEKNQVETDPLAALTAMTSLYLAERIVRELFPQANLDDSVLQFGRQPLVNLLSAAVCAGWEFKDAGQGVAKVMLLEKARREFEEKFKKYQSEEKQ